MTSKKLISIVTPCYNEELNVDELYARIKAVFDNEPDYDYEHVFIDNASKDRTVAKVKSLCLKDSRVKLIVNVRNFGHIRSPYHGLLQASGDAVMLMVSDLQDPPELIPDFLRKWEAGFKVVIGVKAESAETPLMFAVRKAYYNLISKISDIELVKNYTGFGIYDKEVIEQLRKIDDPYPYFRGLIAELGYERERIIYKQPARVRGISANNFYTLYDMAMLGITSHSKVPLRLATMVGFLMSVASAFVAVGYLIAKLLFWDQIPFGFAPLIIGVFFIGSIQLFFTGIIGEYIGFIYTQVLKRPLVVEKERVNFAPGPRNSSNS